MHKIQHYLFFMAMALLFINGCINYEYPDPSNVFEISEKEEEIFYNAISEYYSKDELLQIKKNLGELKSKYPEGHYIIVKMNSRMPDYFKEFYAIPDYLNLQEALTVTVHEMTHHANNICLFEYDSVVCELDNGKNRVYFIENYLVKINYNENFKETFTGSKIIKLIEEPTYFDKSYLSSYEELADFPYSIIDELNAYIKSARLSKAYGDEFFMFEHHYNMMRSLYHLNTLFVYANSDKNLWKTITEDKAFVMIAVKLRKMALEEDESIWKLNAQSGASQNTIDNIKSTKALISKTDYVFDKIENSYADKGFMEFKGIGIEAKKFN